MVENTSDNYRSKFDPRVTPPSQRIRAAPCRRGAKNNVGKVHTSVSWNVRLRICFENIDVHTDPIFRKKEVVVGSRKDIKQKYIMEFKFIQIEYFEISRKIFRSSSHFRGCYVLMLPGWEVASFFLPVDAFERELRNGRKQPTGSSCYSVACNPKIILALSRWSDTKEVQCGKCAKNARLLLRCFCLTNGIFCGPKVGDTICLLKALQ